MLISIRSDSWHRHKELKLHDLATKYGEGATGIIFKLENSEQYYLIDIHNRCNPGLVSLARLPHLWIKTLGKESF